MERNLNWMNLKASVPQGSVLGPLLFLIYINDLTDNISSEMRLFANDSSLFTCVNGIFQTRDKLAYQCQWKVIFYVDITKQAIEVIFLVKNKTPDHPKFIFNGMPTASEPFTKYLGVYLGIFRLNFSKTVKKSIKSFKHADRNMLICLIKCIYHNQRCD